MNSLSELQRLLRTKDDKIRELEKRLMERDVQIQELKSQLDKYQSIMPARTSIVRSTGHTRRQRTGGIPGDRPDIKDVKDMPAFKKYNKTQR